jgi:hypothetical protein
MSNVNVNKLSAEIADSLKKFTNEVIEEADKTGERIGKDAVRKLKGSSPKGRRGKYAKKWRLKTIKQFGSPDTQIIHVGKPEYRLAHLLEHGHALRQGGRTKAQPHIAPVEDEVIEEYTKVIKEAIERG